MQNVEVQEDLRIQRSKKLLQQALFDLTVEKGFATVTVRDIAARARVNRSTFYRHYLDKYDLLNQYLTELQAVITETSAAAEKETRTSPEKVPAGLLVLIHHIQEYADFYRVMLGQNGDPMFTAHIRQLSERRYRYLFSRSGEVPDPKAPPMEMKVNYISSATVGAILWWLENGQPASAEQLAIWLGQLSMTSAGLTIQQLKPGQP